jgi:activator of HSP90 ATPase
MVKTIQQKVVFVNTKASMLYSTYLDSKHHSAITGGRRAKISAREGTQYSANGGGHWGKNLHLIKNRLVVQSFYAKDWGKGEVDSTLIFFFEQRGKNAIITFTHANIPDRRAEGIRRGWKNFYWTPWKKYLRMMK